MGRSIVPYLLLFLVGLGFTIWYLVWGASQPPVKSIEEIPGFFNLSNVIASVAYLGSTWLVIYLGSKKSAFSFLILGALVIWYVAVVFLGRLGFFASRQLFAPNLMFAFILLFVLGKKVFSLPQLNQILLQVPINWLIAVQVFRLMGVGFITLYMVKVLPGQFAIPTGVGDIIIGVSAPLVAYVYTLGKSFSKTIAVLWNYLGIADLAMAISLGILTYPEPLHVIQTEVSNLPIAFYPLVIIPVFAVPLSILLHIFTLKSLRQK